MIALNIKDVPENCGSCPISTTDNDCYVNWCAVLNKEIKDMNRKLRGCPIKGKVNESDVIREKKGN